MPGRGTKRKHGKHKSGSKKRRVEYEDRTPETWPADQLERSVSYLQKKHPLDWDSKIVMLPGHRYKITLPFPIPVERDADGATYHDISSSALASAFSPPFLPYEVAQRTIKKRGLDTTREVLAEEWRVKGDTAAKRGTKGHAAFELRLNNHRDSTDPEVKSLLKWFNAFREDVLKPRGIKPYRTELRVACQSPNSPHVLAGTIDLLAYKGDEPYIIDWKCMREISSTAYGKKMLPPFNDIPDSKRNRYWLQLGIYRYMLEQLGIVVPWSNLMLVAVCNSGYQFYDYSYYSTFCLDEATARLFQHIPEAAAAIEQAKRDKEADKAWGLSDE